MYCTLNYIVYSINKSRESKKEGQKLNAETQRKKEKWTWNPYRISRYSLKEESIHYKEAVFHRSSATYF